MRYKMIDYIYESPKVVRKTLHENEGDIRALQQVLKEKEINKVVINGLGSSFTAAAIAEPLFHIHSQYNTIIIDSEEFVYYEDSWIDEKTAVISVSRSGERGAAIEAMHQSKTKGAFTIAITGVENSLMAQSAEIILKTREGSEIAFPKTKSVSTCSAMIMRLGLAFANAEDQQAEKRIEILKSIDTQISETINIADKQILSILPNIHEFSQIFTVGTCSNHGVALEAAIKLQEASLTVTRGENTAALWVGPVSAITDKTLVIVLIMKEDLRLSIDLLKMVKDFGGTSIAVCPETIDVSSYSDYVINVCDFDDPYLAGLVYLPVIQLLTYYLTIEKGLNPDKPRATDRLLTSLLPVGREEPG